MLLSAAIASWAGETLAAAVDIRVNASPNDADEDGTGAGWVSTNTTYLDMGNQPWCGMRFTGVTVPQGAYIISAYVTFTAAASDSSSASLLFYGEDTDDSSAFVVAKNDISSRTRTSTSVSWSSVSSWTSGNTYSTPDLRLIVQGLVNRPGWTNGNSLSILVNRTSGNRRAKSYDNSTSQCPLLHIEYVVIAKPVATRLLFVVTSTSSPTAQETQRKTFFQDIGYNVTLIASTASQALFDAAAAANDVAYISAAIASTDVNTKLYSKPLGIVNEEPALSDEFAVSSTFSSPSVNAITITKNNHYITSPLSTGSLTITNSVQTMNTWTGTLAPDLNTLATISGTPSLVAVEMNGKLFDGSTASGRRVFLPWSSSAIDLSLLTDNGYILLGRSLAWAGGVVGYWRLDEISGTTASDSSVNAKIGTLTNSSFSTASVVGKVDRAFKFDGVDDYVLVPSNNVFQLTKALSASAWIKANSWGSGSFVNTILRKGDVTPNNWQLAIENGYVALALDGSDGSNVHGNTLLQTGRWYHVAGTWDGSYIRIYVNGVLDNTPTARAAPINTDTRDVYMGGRINTTDLFNGTIDDVRLYNHALDADEITVLNGQGRQFVQVIKWVEIQ